MSLFAARLIRLFSILMVGTLIVVGCASGAQPDTQTAPPTAPAGDTQADMTPANQDAYPAPESNTQVEGYPAPTDLPAAEARAGDALPTPSSSDVGTIAGTFARNTPDGPVPLQFSQLYLGEVIYDDQGQRQAAAYTNEAPAATTDADGHFAFTDLPPGEYALFYWTPESSILLPDLETSETLIITLEGGELVDLGLLVYDF